MKKCPVVHFEVPYEDRKRVSAFYSKAFGWDMQNMGEKMDDYIIGITTELGKNGRPKNPGAINGGFFKKTKETGGAVLLTVAVDDINESMESVRKAGGKILGEPYDIPGVGLYVAVLDSEGNRVSLLQPKEM